MAQAITSKVESKAKAKAGESGVKDEVWRGRKIEAATAKAILHFNLGRFLKK